MAKLRHKTISRRTVEALKVEKDTVFWDSELIGFGVRVYPSGSKYYVVQTKAGGATTRLTVGRHGILTAEEARRRAALMIARIKAGEEPVPEPMAKLAGGPTVGELAARYLEEHVAVHCKPATAAIYGLAIDKHIVPAFGKVPILALGREQVTGMHYKLRYTPYMANMAIRCLSRMFNKATDWGLVPEGINNPCRFAVMYKEPPRERFLTEEEFRRLGRVLSEVEADGVIPAQAAAALRLLMLTGCRRGEILTLRWKEVDLAAGELRLADSKTGARTIPLSPEAVRVLAGLPRVAGNPWVVSGTAAGARMSDISPSWQIVRARAGLEDVRLHDLRHSFASRALALGESLPMIGKLLGHTRIETTARYAHLARDSVDAAAAKVAASIGADILGNVRENKADIA